QAPVFRGDVEIAADAQARSSAPADDTDHVVALVAADREERVADRGGVAEGEGELRLDEAPVGEPEGDLAPARARDHAGADEGGARERLLDALECRVCHGVPSDVGRLPGLRFE